MIYVVVFDTNILFSGFGWRGNPFRCLQLARTAQIVSVTCDEILSELEEKLQLKMGMSSEQAAQASDKARNFSRLVTITNTLVGISTDPHDDKILECAVVGSATHIVTGDRRHLLPLGAYQGISIVTAADFLALVSPP